jgi:hypothetical protein
MSVVFQFQLPVSYEQFQELNKKVNPENLTPTGCLLHIVSRNESGLSLTDVWEDEAAANSFYQGAAEAGGMQFPQMSISEVMHLMH